MSECEYRYVCPIGECGNEKSVQCIGRLIDAISELKQRCRRSEAVPVERIDTEREIQPKIFYACDHRACETCEAGRDFTQPNVCQWTSDIEHAKNFYKTQAGVCYEKI